MELFKRKENYLNPVNTARRNFQALGFIYVVVGIILFANNRTTAGLIIIAAALIMFVITYLLNKNKIQGSYLAWVVVIIAFLFSIMSVLKQGLDGTSIISILILIYVAYWNHKAFTFLKSNKTPEQPK